MNRMFQVLPRQLTLSVPAIRAIVIPFRRFAKKSKAPSEPIVATDLTGSGFSQNLTGKSRTGYSVRDSDVFQNRLHEWRVIRRYQGRLKVQ